MRSSFAVSARRLLLPLLLGLIGCSSPSLPPVPPDGVILAFGDSLTFGTGAPKGASYPAVLARLTGREVINAGVPGEESDAGLARLPGLLDRHAPDLLLLCHGGNDMLRHRDLSRTEANLRAMVREARSRGIPVVMLAVPRPGIFMSPADLYGRVAEEMEVPLEDDVLPDILTDRDLKSDTAHPNAAGYRRLAGAVAELLRETGAI